MADPLHMDDFLTSNRWLKASGVSISCEEKMRQIARGLLGENHRRRSSPTFIPPKLWWGGDTRSATCFHARSQPKGYTDVGQ